LGESTVNAMKFTVLIPLFNKAPYIRCTLDSILAQRCTDYEILVIDDGSTDGGDDIVNHLTDDRIRLIRQPNAGVSAARNRGIAEARGEWVSFLDADDWQHPDFLAALLLAQAACPDAKTVATDFLRLPHTEGPWPPNWRVASGQPEIERITDLAARWVDAPSVCSSAIAARRDLLQSMQPCFPLGESVGEDLDLWFRLAEKAPIALVRSPLAAYRVAVQGSLTTQHTPTEIPPFLRRLRDRALTGLVAPAQRRSALWMVAQHEVTLARLAIEKGQRRLGLRWLYRGRRAALGRRWWLTLMMTLFFPTQWVHHWQHWRIQRASPVASMTDAG
jgi:glycosyltransferase involved in cell wall biosynthesis